MKKFAAILLALTMVFSICGFSAFAADPVTITLAVSESVTYPDFVGSAELDGEGDMFEVVVAINGVNATKVKSAEMTVTWDPEILEAITPAGTTAPAVAPYIYGESFPVRGTDPNTYLPTGAFDWSMSRYADGRYDLTAFINPEAAPEYSTGYDIPEGQTTLEFATLLFKVKQAGDPKFDVSAMIVNLEDEAPATFDNSDPITIGGGDTPEPELATITAIPDVTLEAVDAPAEGETTTVDLPTTVTATLSDETTVELPVTWEPAEITVTSADAGSTLTATGTVTVDAEVYELAEGVDATVTASVAVNDAEEPEPDVATITAIAPVEVETTVGVAPVLPETVSATVEGETEAIALAVTWDTVEAPTEPGTITVEGEVTIPTGYELAEGLEATVTATVTVTEGEEPEVITITAIEAVEVSTYVGVAPILPETVTATAGEEEVEVTVDWGEVAVPTEVGEYEVEGTVTVPEGYELGEGVEAVAVVTVTEAPEPSTLPVVAELVCTDGAQGKMVQMRLSLNEDYEGDAEAALNGTDIVVAFNFMNGNTPVQRQAVFQIISKNAIVSGDVAMGFTGIAIPEGTTSITAGIVQSFDPEADITVDNLGEAIAVATPITIE